MTLTKLVSMLYSFIMDQRAACYTLLNAFLKSTKYGRSPVDAEGISHTVFSVENLFSCTASWYKACLFLSYNLFCLRLHPV